MGLSDTAPVRAWQVFMSCNHPFKAFDTGYLTPNGKKDFLILPSTCGNLLPLSYAEAKHAKVSPSAPLVEINGRTFIKDPIPIPCGSCVGCRMMAARDWKVRMCLESLLYPGNTWFVTLTYDDVHLPFNENGEPIVIKKHAQNFIKWLRTYTQRPFRYYMIGEYGGVTHRPHYHAILYGEFSDLFPVSFNVYRSPEIAHCWPFGLHELSPAEPGSIAYTAGYMEKKQKDPFWNTYPVKPFRIMSRKPMLGYKSLSLIGYPDVNVYGNFGNSHSCKAPKAFLKKLEEAPWYEDYKAFLQDLAKRTLEVSKVVYGQSDEDSIGFSKDAKLNASLEDKRRNVL